MSTMHDIAAKVGVSQSTVSRVLTGGVGSLAISQETRARILEAAEELGYRIDPLARATRGKSTHVIGMIARVLDGVFLPRLAAELAKCFRQKGYDFIVTAAANDPNETLRLQRLFETQFCDGLILAADPFGFSEAQINTFFNKHLVMTAWGSPIADIPLVNTDNIAGVRQAMQHLLQMGHQRIGFLDVGWSGDTMLRRQAYLEIMDEAEYAPYIVSAVEGMSDGYAATRRSLLPRNLLTFFLLAAVMPLIGTLLTSFKDPTDLAASPFALPREWHFENYTRAWSEGRFGNYFVNSIVVVVAVMGISAFLTVLPGFALGLLKFRGKAIINISILMGLMVPFEAVIIPLWSLMRDLGLYNTLWALILPQVALSFSFGTFWMQAYFKGVPDDLVDAAIIDGCSSWSLLWRVLFPMAQPSILSMIVLLFIWTWNEFLLVLVMIQKDTLRTLPVGLASLQGRFSTNLALVAAATVIVTVPTLIIYFIFQRQFINGVISGAVRG